MKLIKNISLLVLLALGVSTASAQNVLVKLSLDKDSMLVGDQVNMTLNISYNKTLQIQLPAFSDTLVPGVEVVKKSKLDTLRSKDKNNTYINVQQKYTLTSFDGGIIYTLPQIKMLLRRDTVVDTISSNILTLKVLFPPLDSTFRPNDIKPPVQYPITFKEVLPYVGIVWLILGLLAFLIYVIQKRRKNQPLFFKPKPKEPAHIIAFRALDKLKNDQLWQQGKTKEFYTRISEIIRMYLEERYHIQAMEQTSEEILQTLNSSKYCDQLLIEKLKDAFFFSDLAKFAKYTPQPDENEVSLSNIYLFVERTKLEISTVAPEGKNTEAAV